MKDDAKPKKPLGHKAYGSIGHLPTSRLGPCDRHVPDGQAKICTTRRRDRHDFIYVQEKLDGSCCAVAKLDDWTIVPLVRAGYPAKTSPFEQHHLFHDWVMERVGLFSRLLKPGERFVGEWLAQAHGTRYRIDDPDHAWVVFDLMQEHRRATVDELRSRVMGKLLRPRTEHHDDGGPILLPSAWASIRSTYTLPFVNDSPEGLVYRVERKGKVDFLAKWVRPDKQDGHYLPEVSGNEAVWNYRG